ncbi:MAG: DegV family protein [Eubacteriaceae bacterium]|nr:DegV family protein [Eubacteriaceae bacterium]
MGFQIIGDSSLDLNEELEKMLKVRVAPFHIDVGGEHFVDDDTIDLDRLVAAIKRSPEVAQTSAPSPHDYVNLYDNESSGVFIITISSRLSSSYNSALMAKHMLMEKHKGLKVHVVDGRTASVGQTHLAYKIKMMEDNDDNFDTIAEAIDKERDASELYFLLDNIDTLMKNGRMSFLQGMVAQFLHIKPILYATDEGEIGLKDKTRTFSKALLKLAEYVAESRKGSQDHSLMISHCKAEKNALELKKSIESMRQFKEVFIVPMKGLTTTYSNVGGLICSI